MKKKIHKIIASVLMFISVLSLLVPFGNNDTYYGASSYTNAKEFYNSTGENGKPYHADMINGTIYYATCAKLASSSSNLRYHTVGFDIELSANGRSVLLTVQRTGGSMREIHSVKSGGYEYILYAVEDEKLYELASKANPSEYAYILNASVIHINMNAIITTKQGTRLNGGITENGAGGFTPWGTIYRLKDTVDLNEAKRLFTGHKFESYINISEDLENYKLQIQYKMNGTDSFISNNAMAPNTTIGNNKFALNASGVICQNGNPVITSSNVLNRFNLLNPYDASVTKTGYHLPEGKEWLYNNQTFSATATYMPKEICPAVGYGSENIYMYANWQANEYTVAYNANGGSGTVAASSFTYDQNQALRENVFTRTGYKLKDGEEWNTKPDGTGTSYSSGEVTKNLTTENNATVTLYANWEPNVYEITTDQQGGNGGTDVFYEIYDTWFTLDETIKSQISKITIPNKTGYDFLGYYGNIFGVGDMLVDAFGTINVKANYFLGNSVVYAKYEPKKFTITFNKKGGTGGTDSVVAKYGEYLPFAEAPYKTGYSFKGYYESDSFLDSELYYNQNMAVARRYEVVKDITLYAKWEDDVPPKAIIEASTSSWTNIEEGVSINAYAYDLGTGLDYVELYCDGVLVASKYDLDGTTEVISLEYMHTNEGAYRYKVVACDMEGNISESYSNCKYDIKAPEGTYDVTNSDVTNFSINVHASDYNFQ